MGLSNLGGSGTPETPAPHQSFGDKLGGLLQDRLPIASGITNMITGHEEKPDPGVVSMNAKPQPSGGNGLSMLLKLFGG